MKTLLKIASRFEKILKKTSEKVHQEVGGIKFLMPEGLQETEIFNNFESDYDRIVSALAEEGIQNKMKIDGKYLYLWYPEGKRVRKAVLDYLFGQDGSGGAAEILGLKNPQSVKRSPVTPFDTKFNSPIY